MTKADISTSTALGSNYKFIISGMIVVTAPPSRIALIFYSRPGYFATSIEGENQKPQGWLQEVMNVKSPFNQFIENLFIISSNDNLKLIICIACVEFELVVHACKEATWICGTSLARGDLCALCSPFAGGIRFVRFAIKYIPYTEPPPRFLARVKTGKANKPGPKCWQKLLLLEVEDSSHVDNDDDGATNDPSSRVPYRMRSEFIKITM
ncbi:hypothetical protein CBL_07107 [Carabus blaptoides fortunei]